MSDIMFNKEKMHELVDHMPDNFTIDDVVEQMVLLQKIEKSQREIKNGEGIDWENLKKEMDSW